MLALSHMKANQEHYVSVVLFVIPWSTDAAPNFDPVWDDVKYIDLVAAMLFTVSFTVQCVIEPVDETLKCDNSTFPYCGAVVINNLILTFQSLDETFMKT